MEGLHSLRQPVTILDRHWPQRPPTSTNLKDARRFSDVLLKEGRKEDGIFCPVGGHEFKLHILMYVATANSPTRSTSSISDSVE